MVAPIDAREERSWEQGQVEQLKDSAKLPIHLFTSVYWIPTMCQENAPSTGTWSSRADLTLHLWDLPSSGETRPWART